MTVQQALLMAKNCPECDAREMHEAWLSMAARLMVSSYRKVA
jgi:hypothetical protein